MTVPKPKIKTPRYLHDCTMCVFLGSHGRYDVWICRNEGRPDLDSLIARRSGDGSDFCSLVRVAFVKVVIDHLNGCAIGRYGKTTKLPEWMIAVLVKEYGEEAP